MVKTTWKQRVAAAVCTASLALALPMAAFAAPSAENTWTDSAVSGAASASGTIVNETDLSGFRLDVEPSDVQASNTVVSDTQIAIASFVVTAAELQGGTWNPTSDVAVTLTFDLGTQEYNGHKANIYIEHDAGDTEVMTQTIVNGTVTITVDRLSVFTVVVDTESAPAPGQPGTDQKPGANKAPTSPQTGVDVAGAAAGTAVMAVAAAGVVVTLRKRVNG